MSGCRRCSGTRPTSTASCRSSTATWRGPSGGALEAFTIAERLHLSTGAPTLEAQLLSIRAQQGRLAELADFVTQGIEDFETLPGWDSTLAEVFCGSGRHAEAAALLDRKVADGFAGAPFDSTWLLVHTTWADCAADLGSRRRRPPAHRAARPVCGAGHLHQCPHQGGRRPVARPLSCPADRRPRPAPLPGSNEALQLHRRLGARYWIARTELELADALDARRAVGDAERATELTADAVAAVDRYGFDGLRPNPGPPPA